MVAILKVRMTLRGPVCPELEEQQEHDGVTVRLEKLDFRLNTMGQI